MARNTSGLRRGGPGRPKGVPNKATQDVQAFAREFLNDPKGVESYRQQYQEGKLPPAVWQLLMHYAYGKPKDTVEWKVAPLVVDEIAGPDDSDRS